MARTDKIFGLREQNGKIYFFNCENEWQEASTELLPEIEAIKLRLKNFQYPFKTIKESMVFENESEVGGIGSIKTIKDDDGDLTVKFQADENINTDFNEDDVFSEDIVKTVKKKDENNQINPSKQKLIKITITDSKSASSNTDTKEKQYKPYEIIKRNKIDCIKYKFFMIRRKIMHVILEHSKKLSKNIEDVVIPLQVYNYSVNYQSKKKMIKQSGLSATSLLKSLIEKRKKDTDSIFSNFCIRQANKN